MRTMQTAKISTILNTLKTSAGNGLNAVLSPNDSKLLLALLLEKKQPINQIVDGLTAAAKEVIDSFGDDLRKGKL